MTAPGTRAAEPAALGGTPEAERAFLEEVPLRERLMRGLSFRNISAIYVLAALIALFGLWIPDLFLTVSNVKAILYENSVTAIVAVGLVAPFAAGVFDASIGATLGLASVLGATLMARTGIPWLPATLMTIGAGVVVGLVNALLVVRLRVDSIIATLAMMSVLIGLGSAVGGDDVIVGLPQAFERIGSNTFLGLAIPVWMLLVVALLVSYVLDRTVIGRRTYATGGSEETARLAGVRTHRIVVGALVASAAIAALAGIVATARVGAGQAAIGPPYLLPAFAAVFLGATQFRGGRFNVWGTVLGAYTLGVGVKGLSLAGAPAWLPDVFNGAALALAVALSVRRARVASGSAPQARDGWWRRLLGRGRATPASDHPAAHTIGADQ